MEISPADIIPVFSKPAATFDRPSQSFADFLGDAKAQGGRDATQASSFGAEGLFGAAAASPGTHPTPGPDQSPASNASEPGESASGRTMPSAPDGTARRDPATAPESAAGLIASSPGPAEGGEFLSPVGLLSEVAGFQPDPSGFLATANPFTTVEPPVGQPSEGPEAEIDSPSSSQATAPEQQEQAVLIAGEGDMVDVHMASFAASEIDRAHLLRLANSAAADHGVRIGNLGLNGERLTATNQGGIYGYRR